MGDNRINRGKPSRYPFARPAEIKPEDIAGMGHNGGPPLDDPHVPEWGTGGIGNYFQWKSALDTAFNKVPYDTAVRRARKAEQLGLTYREYTLEILERGRYLQVEDKEIIAAIIARRKPA
jgi:hypothetical protein